MKGQTEERTQAEIEKNQLRRRLDWRRNIQDRQRATDEGMPENPRGACDEVVRRERGGTNASNPARLTTGPVESDLLSFDDGLS